MYLAETLPYGQKVGAEKLGGLQIFQNGQELEADLLSAHCEGNRVIVSGEAIQFHMPTQVKFAGTGWYMVNLYNSEGIPARPSELTC